jgi:rubrerythrin
MTTLTASTITLENLQAAFNGESNASARYAEFAKKATGEGYLGIASLFRAGAKAEEFHARNHAEVIRRMGAEPKAIIESVVVKCTTENLLAAIAGEVHERDVMYPEFLKNAKQNKDSDAIRTFTYALKTEAEHARLYSNALKNMEKMKLGKTYFVCAVCGYTLEVLTFVRCLVCGHAKDDYIRVS